MQNHLHSIIVYFFRFLIIVYKFPIKIGLSNTYIKNSISIIDNKIGRIRTAKLASNVEIKLFNLLDKKKIISIAKTSEINLPMLIKIR